jgi:hypothetical protein
MKSIHSWKQFMEVFIIAHVDYVYDELFNELEEICRLENESMDDLFQRVMQIYCRFPKSDKPSDQEIFDWFSYLISISEGYNLIIKLSLIHKIHICTMNIQSPLIPKEYFQTYRPFNPILRHLILQSDFKEPSEETVSIDDVKSILNEESIHQVCCRFE